MSPSLPYDTPQYQHWIVQSNLVVVKSPDLWKQAESVSDNMLH